MIVPDEAVRTGPRRHRAAHGVQGRDGGRPDHGGLRGVAGKAARYALMLAGLAALWRVAIAISWGLWG